MTFVSILMGIMGDQLVHRTYQVLMGYNGVQWVYNKGNLEKITTIAMSRWQSPALVILTDRSNPPNRYNSYLPYDLPQLQLLLNLILLSKMGVALLGEQHSAILEMAPRRSQLLDFQSSERSWTVWPFGSKGYSFRVDQDHYRLKFG